MNGARKTFTTKNGYATISREWKKGDHVELELPMPVRELVANPQIKDDQGKMALQRGPLVYCAEWPDNKDKSILKVALKPGNKYSAEYLPGLLNGVTVIHTKGYNSVPTADKHANKEQLLLTAIPYYSWANRGPGEMSVWMNVKK